MRAGALTIVMTCVLAASAQAAYERPATVEHVTRTHDGAAPDHLSFEWDMSPDGRYIAFDSYAENLIPADARSGEYQHIYVRDLATGVTRRVSQSSAGVPGDGMSSNPSISADGNTIVFSGWSGKLVDGDRGAPSDVFVHDLDTRTTRRISQLPGGAGGNEYSLDADVSADGRRIVYTTYASNLVTPDAGNWADTLLFDRDTGTTTRVSDPAGAQADGSALYPAISGDGRFVAFTSGATDLDASDTNGVLDVYVKDLETGAVEWISRGGDEDSSRPSLSHDGRFVAYMSFATTLVPDDDNAIPDVFVHDRLLGVTRRVSVSSAGAQSASGGHQHAPGNYFPTISPDGRYVAINSEATGLTEHPAGGQFHAFVHDLQTGATIRPLRTRLGGLPAAGAGRPILGLDGASLSFISGAADLVEEPVNAYGSIFVHRRGPSLGTYDVTVTKAAGRLDATGAAGFAGATVTRAADPAGDTAALPAGDLRPGALAGADLTGASLAVRPELGDLFARLELDRMPLATGVPGLRYELAFTAGGTAYRAVAGSDATFTLQRCAASACTDAGTLRGAIGQSGKDVTLAIPLSAIGNPVALTAVRAGTTVAEQPADELAIGSADLSPPKVELSLSPSAGWRPAELSNGRFTGSVPTAGFAGAQTLWTRACTAGTCATSAIPVTLDRAQSTLALVVEGRGARRVLRVLLATTENAPLAGRSIVLRAGSTTLGTVTTDAAGGAVLDLPAQFQGGHQTFTATFAGDDEAAGSAATATS